MKTACLEGKDGPLKAAPYLPQLTLPSGEAIGGAVPISKWAAAQGQDKSLYPADSDTRLFIDEAIDIIYAVQDAPSIKGKEEEEGKAIRGAFADATVKPGLAMFAKRLDARGGGPFLMGAQMTLADLWGAFVVGMLKKGIFDHIPASLLDAHPSITAMNDAVMASDLITSYQAAYADTYKF